MKKLILIGSLLLCLFYNSEAQTGVFNEALLFSRTTFGGSARMQSLGGPTVSLGGDISSAIVNPAGLGFYNRSEFTFTTGFNFQNSDSRFNGINDQTTSSFDNGISLNNLGAVFNNTNNGESKFKGWNFAISLDRTNDLNQELKYEGENNDNSLAFALSENAFNVNTNLLQGLEFGAFETFVINPIRLDNGNLEYDPINLTDIVEVGGNSTFFYSFPIQEEIIRRSGAQNQWNFSAGGNYDDLIYFGGGIGIATIRYQQDKVFTERDYFVIGDGVNVFDGDDTALGGLTLREDLQINGTGINGTLGVIVRPAQFVSFGLSYVTPTFYTMNEESSFTLSNVINSTINTFGGDEVVPGSYEFESDVAASNYSLRTPGKLNLGASFFLGKYGFITGSVEFVDYTTASLKSTDFDVDGDNNIIDDSFSSTTNFRIGSEFRLDSFRLRMGYSALNNPFAPGQRSIFTNNLSFGVGYKTSDYFVDLGVINSNSRLYYSPYQLLDDRQPVIDTQLKETKVVLTVGFTF